MVAKAYSVCCMSKFHPTPQAKALQVGDGREREREEEDEVGSSASRCAGKSGVSQASGIKHEQNSPGPIVSGI